MGRPDRIHQEASLTDDVYYQLKDYLLSDIIRPPERIQIGQLSKHFTVSITPIREALIRLATEGIIELKPGRGFFYKDFLPAEQIRLYELIYCVLHHVIRSSVRAPRSAFSTIKARCRSLAATAQRCVRASPSRKNCWSKLR